VLEEVVRHQQRLDRLPGVDAAGRDGLVGGLIQVVWEGRSGSWTLQNIRAMFSFCS
jgi:hypothetical protein